MFGRIRRLEISLAAKCQILFGAAVLLIIAAALLVPWQRMEQLTQQLDERAAAALADDAVARHLERGGASDPTPPVAAPEPGAESGDTDPADDAQANANASGDGERDGAGDPPPPTTRPARERQRDRERRANGTRRGNDAAPPQPAAPRLLSHHTEAPLTRFERKALYHFNRHRDDDRLVTYYERDDDTDGYRYARPLYLVESCTRCHSVAPGGALTT